MKITLLVFLSSFLTAVAVWVDWLYGLYRICCFLHTDLCDNFGQQWGKPLLPGVGQTLNKHIVDTFSQATDV